ncbi:hypothetical protein ABZV77_22950 [Streptomyces sp. NPDC004732]|uniref:hypothetical protein n=1 Tax=Streptomyces sp. NPDC004732 TaxID=3154290 RepID=UPI0033AC012C
MTYAYVVLHDLHGLIETEFSSNRAPHEALVNAVLAWTDPDLAPGDYEQIALQVTGLTYAVAPDAVPRIAAARRRRTLISRIACEDWLTPTSHCHRNNRDQSPNWHTTSQLAHPLRGQQRGRIRLWLLRAWLYCGGLRGSYNFGGMAVPRPGT